MTQIPPRLYKYRAFNHNTLEALIDDQLFFADPSTFNDPLDCKPSLEVDIDAESLERVITQLAEKRINAEMIAALKTIEPPSTKTLAHIAERSKRAAAKIINDIDYEATNPAYDFDIPKLSLLGHALEREILRRYDKGIVSLAERYDCPLMWSHYGDQHQGICLGYSIPSTAGANLHKITYGGSRSINAKTIAAMLDGKDATRRRVDKAVLTRKAKDWRYEREWRLIGTRGKQDSPLELEEIIFGMRCSHTVKFATISSLAKRRRPVRFYEIRQNHGRFDISRYDLDDGEMASLPRHCRDVYDYFEPITDE